MYGKNKMKKNRMKLLIISIFVFTIVILISIAMAIDNVKISRLEKVALEKNVLLDSESMNEKFSRISKTSIRLDNELNSIWKLCKYPSNKEANQLPRRGQYVQFLNAQINEKKQIENITSYIQKNKTFISKINGIENLNEVRLVANIIKPDYLKIERSCANVSKASFLFYIITENEIINNNSSKAVKTLVEISQHGTVLLHVPFTLANMVFNLNTIFLLDGINRTINGLELSDSDLRLLIVLLKEREKDLKQNFQVLLQGATFNFCQLVDENNYINVGSMYFWDKIGLDKKVPSSHTLPFRIWPLFNKSIEKTNMLEDVMEIKNNLIDYDNFQLVKTKWRKFKKQRASRPSPSFSSTYINFSEIFYENIAYVTYIRTQEVLIASILYKRKYGDFQKRITDLSPEYLSGEDLIDPYNGKALHIKLGDFNALMNASFDRKGNAVKKYKKCFGLRIYSVGSNGKDQGGRAGNGLILQSDNKNDDITSILIIKL